MGFSSGLTEGPGSGRVEVVLAGEGHPVLAGLGLRSELTGLNDTPTPSLGRVCSESPRQPSSMYWPAAMSASGGASLLSFVLLYRVCKLTGKGSLNSNSNGRKVSFRVR